MSQHTCTIDDLPEEIIALCFQFLDHQPLLACSEVCQSWHQLARDEDLWERLCKTQFSVSSLPERLQSWREFYIQLRTHVGYVLQMGDCSCGRTGTSQSDGNVKHFLPLSQPEKRFQAIHNGWFASAFLDEDNHIWGTGDRFLNPTLAPIPVSADDLKRLKMKTLELAHICCNEQVVAGIDMMGRVWQLSDSTREMQCVYEEDVATCLDAADQCLYFCVNDGTEVLVKNNNDQPKSVKMPEFVKTDPICRVDGRQSRVCFLTRAGRVILVEENQHEYHGVSDEESPPIAKFRPSLDMTQPFAVGQDGFLYELIETPDSDQSSPEQKLKFRKPSNPRLQGAVIAADAGNQNCAILFADGHLIGRGDGGLGQLGKHKTSQEFVSLDDAVPKGYVPFDLSGGYFHVGILCHRTK